MTKILYLTDYLIRVIDLRKHVDNQKYVIYESSWDELDSFDRILSSSSKDSFSIIFDFADEHVEYDWQPKLMPWEKSGYTTQIKNKFKASNGLFINIEWLGQFRKNSHGAAEQLMLTSSVFGNDHVNKFFSMIEKAELSIESIYSYYFLLEEYFLKKISRKSGISKKDLKKPFLLNFQESKHELKQMFFNEGRLRVTRTIEIDKDINEDSALTVAIAGESMTTIKYLYNQKILPFNTEVGLIHVDTGFYENIDIIKVFKSYSKIAEGEKTAPYKLLELSKIQKIDNEKVLEFGVIGVIASFVKNNRVSSFYTNAFVEKLAMLKKLRGGLSLLFFAIVFFGSIYIVNLLVEDVALKEKISGMDRKLSQYRVEMEALQKTISLEHDAKDIKASVDFSESISKIKSKKMLEKSFILISEAISDHEHILISKLRWSKVKNFDSKKVEVVLEGWVYPFEKSFELPVKWVDALVEQLNSNNKVEKVEILTSPLDRELQRSLSISAGNVDKVNALPFSLKLMIGYME